VPEVERLRLEQSLYEPDEPAEEENEADDDNALPAEPDEECWLALMSQDAPEDEPAPDPEKVVRPDTEKNLRLCLRRLHFVLEEHAPQMRAQHVDERDYQKVIEIFTLTLLPRRPRAVANKLQLLRSVLGRVAPGQSYDFLLRQIRALRELDGKDPVEAPAALIGDLLATGVAIMKDAFRRLHDLHACKNPYQGLRDLAELYRNGLAIALFAVVPLRIRTLSLLTDGDVVVWAGRNYAIDAPPEIMKNNKHYYEDLPAELTPWINKYRFFVREFIAPKATSNAFLLSRNDCPLDRTAFQRALPSLIQMNCHAVRRVHASENAGRDPMVVASILQQSDTGSLPSYQSASALQNLPKTSSLKHDGDRRIQQSRARKQ